MNQDEISMIVIALYSFSSMLKDAGLGNEASKYDRLAQEMDEGKGE